MKASLTSSYGSKADAPQKSQRWPIFSGSNTEMAVQDWQRTSVRLVRQPRDPIARVLLEWPAGKRDAGEPTIACAQRELLEETGYTATEWAWAGWIHNAAAYSSEGIALWFARGLLPGPARPDAGEFVEAVTLPLSALAALDARGELTDVKTLIGLHWLQAALSGHRSWSWTSAGNARDVA